MLTFLQASDVHLREQRPGSVQDLDYELRHALAADARKVSSEIGGVSGILVCGDIAFAGRAEEYAQAATWLRNLCTDLGIAPWNVWIVPGNHDIQHELVRKVPQQRLLRSRLRTTVAPELDRRLRDILQDPDEGTALFAPLTNYLEFAAQYNCEISPDAPYWEARLPLATAWHIGLRGITSPLISDEEDDEKANRLVVGEFQAMVLRTEGVVQATLCHHPPTWLLDGDEVAARLDPVVHVQVTGHDHAHEIRTTRAGLHLCAGALHPERPHQEDHKPRYNFISIEVVSSDDNHTQLEVTVRPRVWDSGDRRFISDPAVSDGAIVRLVDLGDVAPAQQPASMTPAHEPKQAQHLDDHRRRLHHRLALLASGDRFAVAREVGFETGRLARLPHHLVPREILAWADSTGKLAHLWAAVEARHGDQQGTPNPFEGAQDA